MNNIIKLMVAIFLTILIIVLMITAGTILIQTSDRNQCKEQCKLNNLTYKSYSNMFSNEQCMCINDKGLIKEIY